MIKKLKLENFKSHKDTSLTLGNLTVLCGTNGVGKSSAIHALLLLREAFLNNSNFEYLDLQPKSVNVGSVNDALYQFSDSNEINFELETTSRTLRYSFNADLGNELEKTLLNKSVNTDHFFDKNSLQQVNLYSREFQFISAARLGPQISYPKNDVVVDVHNQISVEEGKAEHFIHFLNKKRNKTVMSMLLNDNISDDDLFSQTSAWENEISKGVNIVVKDSGNLGYELKYQFNTESGEKTNEFKAANVGFGLTYALPIIVAILSAEPNTLLLIENPEAHLHPHGQARLTELICFAAQAGVQIIIESHSDHVINGILVNCKKFELNGRGINRENVSIHYFDRNEEKHYSNVKGVNIEEGGRVRYTPDGFFDQFTIDRKFLMGF